MPPYRAGGKPAPLARRSSSAASGSASDRPSRCIRTVALPGAPASVQRDGGVLTFESCDPGTAADVGSDSSGDALQLALARTYIAIDFYRGAGDPASARCFGDTIVHEFTPEQLTDPNLGEDDPSFQARLIRIARRCV